jgi:hypothetical protein
VYTNVFGPSSGYELKNWRLGYSAANSTCAYNTSFPVYQPDWCSWSGVGCDGNTYKVTSLDISGSSWTKTSRIPTAIGALTNLQSLRLSNAGLTGPIPNLAGLSQLTGLDMSSNRLTGSVPAFVNAMYPPTQSWSLSLGNNCNLTSSVPAVNDRLTSQGNCAPLPPGKHSDLSVPHFFLPFALLFSTTLNYSYFFHPSVFLGQRPLLRRASRCAV